MEFYWVNVGVTISEVLEDKFLWAPEASQTKSGNVKHLDHWDNVAKVNSGDLIFCCHDKAISHIAVAQRDAYRSPRPPDRSFSAWGDMGHRVDVTLVEIRVPVHRDMIADDFMSLYDSHCTPSIFTSGATLKQIYMAHLPRDAGVYLLDAANTLERFENELITEGGGGKPLSKTTRKAIVDARIGQGKYRSDLLLKWGKRCSLTGLSNTDLLVASHIHAWSLSNNEERIDPDNGLLLATHIDRLFDRGLISFDDDGRLLVGESLTAADQKILALDQFTTLRSLTTSIRKYLVRHRQRYDFE